jgi:hypothetical protein
MVLSRLSPCVGALPYSVACDFRRNSPRLAKLWAARNTATEYVLHDPEAIADFGGELKTLDASFNGSISGGKSTIRFDVVGPAGSATVTVVSHRYKDAWQVDSARYERAGVLHDISPRP